MVLGRGLGRGILKSFEFLAEIGLWEGRVVGKGVCGLFCFSMSVLLVCVGKFGGAEFWVGRLVFGDGFELGGGCGVEIKNSFE